MKSFQNYNLKQHNSFGIECRCRRFVEYSSVDELRSVIDELRESSQARVLHIGGGNNLLFTGDFDGVVLHSALRGVQVLSEADGSVLVKAMSGEDWDEFVDRCVECGWHGLENLSLIPGEVGASAVQNIGAYGIEVCNYIDSVEAVDAQTGVMRVFTPAECRYGYRSSIFKHELRGRYYVTSVTFRLSTSFTPDLQYKAIKAAMTERGLEPEQMTPVKLRQLIIDIRRSKLPDTKQIGNAGSFFVNPVVGREVFERLYAQYPQMPHYLLPAGDVKIPAGWLIEQSGWKGRSMGRAGVWPLQALVLVNLGGATGQDIVALAEEICRSVKEKFGIEIRPEVNFI